MLLFLFTWFAHVCNGRRLQELAKRLPWRLDVSPHEKEDALPRLESLSGFLFALGHRGRMETTQGSVKRRTGAKFAIASEAPVEDRGDLLCLIDGHALAYRMYYALQKTGMSTRHGDPSYALHGFLYKLLDLAARFPEYRMFVAFDSPGKTFRSEELATYKSSRPKMPFDLQTQMDAIFEALNCIGIPAVAVDGFEADDIIATCVQNARSAGDSSVVIVSTDKDLMQLVSEKDSKLRVCQWIDKKELMMDADEVVKKFGVPPSQMCDFLALTGDSSDDVPGVPGVGPKTAAKLLGAHPDLESILTSTSAMKKTKVRQSLIDNADIARRALELVTLRTDVPLEPTCIRGSLPDFKSDKLDAFLEEWNLEKIKQRVQFR